MPIMLPCELTASAEEFGYYVFATNADKGDCPWVVFTVLWFDARCGVLKPERLTGWSVRYIDA